MYIALRSQWYWDTDDRPYLYIPKAKQFPTSFGIRTESALQSLCAYPEPAAW